MTRTTALFVEVLKEDQGGCSVRELCSCPSNQIIVRVQHVFDKLPSTMGRFCGPNDETLFMKPAGPLVVQEQGCKLL